MYDGNMYDVLACICQIHLATNSAQTLAKLGIIFLHHFLRAIPFLLNIVDGEKTRTGWKRGNANRIKLTPGWAIKITRLIAPGPIRKKIYKLALKGLDRCYFFVSIFFSAMSSFVVLGKCSRIIEDDTNLSRMFSFCFPHVFFFSKH